MLMPAARHCAAESSVPARRPQIFTWEMSCLQTGRCDGQMHAAYLLLLLQLLCQLCHSAWCSSLQTAVGAAPQSSELKQS